jgi:hypothetical protein
MCSTRPNLAKNGLHKTFGKIKPKNDLNRHYITLMVVIPSAYCFIKWEGFQGVKLLCINLHNKIQIYNQTISKL